MKESIHCKNILKNGYTIIKNAISKTDCEKLKHTGEQVYKKYKSKIRNQNLNEETIYNLHNKDKIFLKFIKYKKTFHIIRQVLSSGSYNDDCEIIIRQISMRNPKKGHAQQLHNDTRIVGCKYPLVVHIMYMLDDFTKTNGATRIVPKSHLKMSYAVNGKKYKNEKIITGNKGDALIFDASIWHGSAKKETVDSLWGMIFSYSRWFLKPDFDYNKNTPLKLFKNLNIDQKKLLGFNYNPPKDEFSRSSARSSKFDSPYRYSLPK